MTQDKDRKNLNVPPLRFPGFSDEWQKYPIREVAKIEKGNGISKDQLSDDGEECILYGELYTKYKSEIIDEVLSKTKIDSSKLVRSQNNDVIIPCSGETAEDIATARCVKKDGVLLGGDLNIIRFDKQDGAFMSYQLNGKRKYDIARVAQGVSVVHLYPEHLKSIKVSIPQVEEQRKIVRLLSLIDERIATQNKIIDNLQSLIKGLTGKLLREKCCNTDKVRLGDICNISTGKLDANAMEKNGIYPFFTCAESPYLINSYAFDTEALLISGNGANVGYINEYNGKFNAYQRTYVLDNFTENIQYIRLYLKSYLPKRISMEKSASNTPYIVMSTLSDMIIALPNKVMQHKICNMINNLETKFRIEHEVLSNLSKIKKYLLSNLFI